MKVIQLQEQLVEDTNISHDVEDFLQFMEEGANIMYSVKRGRTKDEPCLLLKRQNDKVLATGSYFVGIDWVKENELAIQVSPKMNDGFEVDYVRMLNDSLIDNENFEFLEDLIAIDFRKPPIQIDQNQDILSLFLITEYLNVLHHVVIKGLKKSYYTIEENLKNKIKGKLLVEKNIPKNLVRGHITDNVCSFQIYGIDSNENRILKKALLFCRRQLKVYKYAIDTKYLDRLSGLIMPYFEEVGNNIDIKVIKQFKSNPVFKEYNQALKIAQLLLHRYSYDITVLGKQKINTPPFWIDMSKLFELYVYHYLKKVFNQKDEVRYHLKAHYQELDYLLNPKEWSNPYIIDAKYKPRYKEQGIIKEDAREVSGYARLSRIYSELGLDEDSALPIKCLIIYPDQEKNEYFDFSRQEEPQFEKIDGYVRMYKVGIRLPVIG